MIPITPTGATSTAAPAPKAASPAPAPAPAPKAPSKPAPAPTINRPAPSPRTPARQSLPAPLPPKLDGISQGPGKLPPIDAAEANKKHRAVEADFEILDDKPTKAPSESGGETPSGSPEGSPEGKPVAEKSADPFDIGGGEDKVDETPAAPDKQGRDYTKFPEDLRAIAKALPNKAYAEALNKLPALVEKAKRVDELEAKLKQTPQFFYEREDAFVLDPTYRQAQATYNQVGYEEQHYMAQLKAIKDGEAWFEITGYDQSGQPQYTRHEAPGNGIKDTDAEIRLTTALGRMGQLRQQAQGQLGQIQQSYKSRREAALAELKSMEEKAFTKINEATFSDEDKKYWEQSGTFVPAAFKDHPMTNIAKKIFVGYMRLYKAYENEVQKNQKASKVKTLKQVAGTRPAAAGADTAGDDFVSFGE